MLNQLFTNTNDLRKKLLENVETDALLLHPVSIPSLELTLPGIGLFAKGQAVDELKKAGVDMQPFSAIDGQDTYNGRHIGRNSEVFDALGPDIYAVHMGSLYDKLGSGNYALLAKALNEKTAVNSPDLGPIPLNPKKRTLSS